MKSVVHTISPNNANANSVAIDPTGNVWVADWNNAIVAKLSSSGTYVGSYAVGSGPIGVAVDQNDYIWVTSVYNSLAVDSSNNIWTANKWSNTVSKITSTGTILGPFSVGSNPYMIAFDSSSNPWVVISGSNEVQKLSTSGTLTATYSLGSSCGPNGIAIDSSGFAWIACNGFNFVLVLNTASVAFFAQYYTGSSPNDIAIDSYGHIWVTNFGSSSLTKIIPPNISTFSGGTNPNWIGVDNQKDTWVVNTGNNPVVKLNTAGTTIATYVPPTFSSAPNMMGIAFDTSGNAWIADSNNNVIDKYSESGTLLKSYSTGKNPYGIASDGNGFIWIGNYGSSTVSKMNYSGIIISNYTVGYRPYGIAVDTSNNIWVANSGADTVSKILTNGTVLTFTVGATPLFIAFDSWQNAYITVSGTSNIVKLFPNGTQSLSYSLGSAPYGIAIDGSEYAWVSTNTANNITVISSTGQTIAIFAASSSPEMVLFSQGTVLVCNSASQTVTQIVLPPTPTLAPNTMAPSFSPTPKPTPLPTTGKPTTSKPSKLPTVARPTRLPTPPTLSPTNSTVAAGALSQGETIGIAVGSSLVGLVGLGGLLFLCRRKKPSSKEETKISTIPPVASVVNEQSGFGREVSVSLSQANYSVKLPQGNLKNEELWFVPALKEAQSMNLDGKKFFAFVSHHKTNAASSLATTIKKFVEDIPMTPPLKVFVDQEETHLDLSKLLKHIENSNRLILLLTKDIFHRPFCLLEINHAIKKGIPIAPVLVDGEGYDFNLTPKFLLNLDTKLERESLDLIKSKKVDILEIAYNISNVIPDDIAKHYTCTESEEIRFAQLRGVLKSVMSAEPPVIEISKEDWLEERKAKNMAPDDV